MRKINLIYIASFVAVFAFAVPSALAGGGNDHGDKGDKQHQSGKGHDDHGKGNDHGHKGDDHGDKGDKDHGHHGGPPPTCDQPSSHDNHAENFSMRGHDKGHDHGDKGDESCPPTTTPVTIPAFIPGDVRVMVCTATPMMRANGTLGVFWDILLDQWYDPTAGALYQAAFANMEIIDGVPYATCDNPQTKGCTTDASKVNSHGVFQADSDEAQPWLAGKGYDNIYLKWSCPSGTRP